MANEIVLASREQTAIDDVKRLVNIVAALRNDVFQKDIDFGAIPGTNDKPVLLLPGMEKLMRALHLRAEYELKTVIEDFDKPLFFYRYECRMIDYETGACVATAIGSANSNETKWSGRWVARHQVPANLDPAKLPTRGGTISEFDFAIGKAETSGKYGKPAEYWQQFKDAIANGTARKITKPTRTGTSDAWEIDATQYRIPNPDIFDQINTIDKIAQKRALSSAIKGAANVSMFFTVDLEDFVPYETAQRSVNVSTGEIIEGEAVEIREVTRPTPTQPARSATASSSTASGASVKKSALPPARVDVNENGEPVIVDDDPLVIFDQTIGAQDSDDKPTYAFDTNVLYQRAMAAKSAMTKKGIEWVKNMEHFNNLLASMSVNGELDGVESVDAALDAIEVHYRNKKTSTEQKTA